MLSLLTSHSRFRQNNNSKIPNKKPPAKIQAVLNFILSKTIFRLLTKTAAVSIVFNCFHKVNIVNLF